MLSRFDSCYGKNIVCFFFMIIHLLWIFSGFIVCLFFIYFCVTHGNNPGERFLARLNWLQVIRLADMQALFFGGKDEGRRNKYRTIDITP